MEIIYFVYEFPPYRVDGLGTYVEYVTRELIKMGARCHKVLHAHQCRPNIKWGGEDSNEFRTDEFMRLCKSIEAELYICLNVGSGSPILLISFKASA